MDSIIFHVPNNYSYLFLGLQASNKAPGESLFKSHPWHRFPGINYYTLKRVLGKPLDQLVLDLKGTRAWFIRHSETSVDE